MASLLPCRFFLPAKGAFAKTAYLYQKKKSSFYIYPTNRARPMKKLLLALLCFLPALLPAQNAPETPAETSASDVQSEWPQGEPFAAVEEMPQFPGGEKAMYEWLYAHLNYPESARERGVSGNIWIRLVISETGKVKNAKVARGIDPECDAEALRTVRSMPDWIPGRQNGQKVPVYYTLRIVFMPSR